MALSRSGGATHRRPPLRRERSPSLLARTADTSSRLGRPFLLVGDGLWELEVMARSTADVDTVLTNRAAKGDTAFIMEAFEREYSDNTPKWSMASNSAIPFTTTANDATMSWTSRTSAYWTFVDYIVAKAKALGMAVVINPCYMGLGGTDGWLTALGAAADADLDSYGTFFGQRYGSYERDPLRGGDDAGDSSRRLPGRSATSRRASSRRRALPARSSSRATRRGRAAAARRTARRTRVGAATLLQPEFDLREG
jgi:hypothetical protein